MPQPHHQREERFPVDLRVGIEKRPRDRTQWFGRHTHELEIALQIGFRAARALLVSDGPELVLKLGNQALRGRINR
jgi:hypothetical protein